MAESYRIEKDTMGEVRVPADAYYGAQTARAVQNFPVSGQRVPLEIVRVLGRIKAVAAAVHAERGDLDPELARKIEQAAREVADGLLDEHFPVDVFQTGSGTSTNMNANEVIANRACELLGEPRGSRRVHPNDDVNKGQSSNDVFPTAVQLALAGLLHGDLLEELERLAACWHDLADRTFESIKTGRTHLMDAMPIRFGQELRGHAGHVERWAARIRATLPDLCEVPLGGTAVGTGVNAPPGFARAVCARLAEELGLPVRETTNHFQAQACLDPVVAASGALRGLASALFKIVDDLRWMGSGPLAGLHEVALPAVQPGSSIMPAKVNPVICESVLMVCVQVLANDSAVGLCNMHGKFELNTMLPLLGRSAIDSARLLANASRMLRERCLEGIRVEETPGRLVERNPILATALAARIGYDAAAEIAKEAAASGRRVRDVAAERTDLSAAELDDLLDPRRLCGEHGRTRQETAPRPTR